jgi:uncharacterized protein YbaP (TraB family)
MMHKGRFYPVISLCLTFLFTQTALSQTEGPKTVFWKVSGNGLSEVSWLFGTVHIMPAKQFEAFEPADEALAASRYLVLEMAVDVPLGTQVEWAKRLMLPEGQSIADFVDEAEFSRIKSLAIDTFGMKEMMFNVSTKMKPFAFYSAFIPAIIGEKIEGYELHYSKLAKKNKIEVKELETFDFQLGIFDSIPNERQMRLFFSEEEDLRSGMKRMLEVYQDQDIYAMARELAGDSNYNEFEQQLVVLRNKAWVPKLQEFMSAGSCFIAVGAGHLAGEYGLIGLLREAGYLVEPVMLR